MATIEVINTDGPVEGPNELHGGLEPDTPNRPELDTSNRWLTHSNEFRRPPLRKALRNTPTVNSLTDSHVASLLGDTYTSQNAPVQVETPNSERACERQTFRYDCNMASRTKKLSLKPSTMPSTKIVRSSKAPVPEMSGTRQRVTSEDVRHYQELMKGRSGDRTKGLPDDMMRAFQRWLVGWIRDYCTGTDGVPWGQREIATSIGAHQPEVSAWLGDTARPGIRRLADIHHKTGVPLGELVGLR